MARTPDGASAREVPVTTRMTHGMVADLDYQRGARGGMTRSGYVRWLIQQDGRRIAQERGH